MSQHFILVNIKFKSITDRGLYATFTALFVENWLTIDPLNGIYCILFSKGVHNNIIIIIIIRGNDGFLFFALVGWDKKRGVLTEEQIKIGIHT